MFGMRSSGQELGHGASGHGTMLAYPSGQTLRAARTTDELMVLYSTERFCAFEVALRGGVCLCSAFDVCWLACARADTHMVRSWSVEGPDHNPRQIVFDVVFTCFLYSVPIRWSPGAVPVT